MLHIAFKHQKYINMKNETSSLRLVASLLYFTLCHWFDCHWSCFMVQNCTIQHKTGKQGSE